MLNIFFYAATAASNHQKIEDDSERITKIIPFINKHNWEGIHFSTGNNDWIKFRKKNIANNLNNLYAKREKNIYPDYVSKHNLNR